MAGTKVKDQTCLICTSFIPPKIIKHSNTYDQQDILFLLQFLLEIPKDSSLLKNVNATVNTVQICDNCSREIKQCKQIYGEICEKIERFWESQNKILEKFSVDVNTSENQNDSYVNWVFRCRKFVKDHDFTGFGYPFAVHDLETLLISSQSSPEQLQDNVDAFVTKNEVPAPADKSRTEEPLTFNEPSVNDASLPIKPEPESEDETADIQQDDDFMIPSEDNDLPSSEDDSDYDYKPSPSKKAKLSPAKPTSNKKGVKQVNKQSTQFKRVNDRINLDYPNFKRDPITKKFHCTWSSDCSQKFVDKLYLQYHWDRHRGTPSQKCEVCSKEFYSHNVLARHKDLEHSKDGDFDCKKCGRKCRYRENLLKHERTFHGENEKEILLKLKEKEEDPIKKDPVTNRWLCYWPDCGKTYLERHDLKYHVDRHKGTPQQKCKECGELFYSKNQLERHVQIEHEKGRNFDCEICGKKFKASEDLRSHKSFKHSESGSGAEVVCEICGKTYKKGTIRQHMKFVHGEGEAGGVGVRKFACHLCPGRYKDGTSLKKHLWWVHQFCEREEDREKLERFKKRAKEREYNLKCHVKGCRAKFATEKGLKQHVDGVHKGKWDQDEDADGKFGCEVCGKRFHLKQKFTRHAKQHEKD